MIAKKFPAPHAPRRRLLLRVVALASAASTFGLLAMAGAAAPGGGGGKSKRDNAPPTITASVTQQTTTVVVAGSATDNVGVKEVDVAVDGGAYATATGTSSWSYTIDTTKLSAGLHNVTAKARDAAGNTSTASAGFSLSPPVSTTPPTTSIVAPSANATVTGTIAVNGTASGSNPLAKVELSVDAGAYNVVQGTTSWSSSVNTTVYANGAHTIHARVTDTTGNTGTSSETITVNNDIAPPTVTVTAPASGATVSGAFTVSGTASDDVSVASIAVSVDGGAFAAAQGVTSWSYSLDTTVLSNGSHTVTARATDGTGKTGTSTVTVTVSNSSPSPTGQHLVTPEGVTIDIAPDVTTWTAQQIYDLLKPNAYQLSVIGPHLKIEVQTQYGSATTTGVSYTSTNGYYNYKATIDLDARPDHVFSSRPDKVIAHEYGHAWTMYHLYMSQSGDWTKYLVERGIYGDPRVGSTYNWGKDEMIADDYRMLFGTQAAQDEAAYINPDVPDPRTVPGLKSWFTTVWAGG